MFRIVRSFVQKSCAKNLTKFPVIKPINLQFYRMYCAETASSNLGKWTESLDDGQLKIIKLIQNEVSNQNNEIFCIKVR